MKEHSNSTNQVIPENEFPVDGYSELANAIICRAVDDYRDLFFGRARPCNNLNMTEIKNFFKSEWFKCLTKLDGEYLINRVIKECNIFKETALNNTPEERNGVFIFKCPVCGGIAAIYLVKGERDQKYPVWTAKCLGKADKEKAIKTLAGAKTYSDSIGCGTIYRFVKEEVTV